MKPETIRKNIAKICKTDDEKYTFMETCLGLAAEQASFIAGNADFLSIPPTVSYAMALTAANMLALHGERKTREHHKLDLSMSELTTKEKLLKVVKHLIDIYGKEATIQSKS